jgi:hypothetical protein
MEARLADERDTLWESTTTDFRVFLMDGHYVSAFDLDAVSLDEVEAWASDNALPGVRVSIALRTTNIAGQLGLVWLRGQPV